MKYCSKHHSNPDNAIFCSECGERIKEQVNDNWVCSNCQTKNPFDAKFCHECGIPKQTVLPPPILTIKHKVNITSDDEIRSVICNGKPIIFIKDLSLYPGSYKFIILTKSGGCVNKEIYLKEDVQIDLKWCILDIETDSEEMELKRKNDSLKIKPNNGGRFCVLRNNEYTIKYRKGTINCSDSFKVDKPSQKIVIKWIPINLHFYIKNPPIICIKEDEKLSSFPIHYSISNDTVRFQKRIKIEFDQSTLECDRIELPVGIYTINYWANIHNTESYPLTKNITIKPNGETSFNLGLLLKYNGQLLRKWIFYVTKSIGILSLLLLIVVLSTFLRCADSAITICTFAMSIILSSIAFVCYLPLVRRTNLANITTLCAIGLNFYTMFNSHEYKYYNNLVVLFIMRDIFLYIIAFLIPKFIFNKKIKGWNIKETMKEI